MCLAYQWRKEIDKIIVKNFSKRLDFAGIFKFI